MLHLRVEKAKAEHAKALLGESGLLNRKMMVQNSARYVLFPILLDAQKTKKVLERLGGGTKLVDRQGVPNARRVSYYDLLSERLSKRELALVARGYEGLGNIAIVELRGDIGSKEKIVGRSIAEANPRISTVLAKAGAVHGTYRTRRLRRIYGKSTYMAHYKENGCSFAFDVRKAFFSAALSFERGRIDALVRDGEAVAVPFAGVGPFAIEIAKHHPHSRVLAIELNADAYRYMKANMKLNRVANLEAVHGDFAAVAERRKGFADRVVVPMPKTSLDFMPAICAIAKARASVHLYAFCGVGKQDELKKEIAAKALAMGRKVRFVGERMVRPYSRNEVEMVFDIVLSRRAQRSRSLISARSMRRL